jgi:hypothetical protein
MRLARIISGIGNDKLIDGYVDKSEGGVEPFFDEWTAEVQDILRHDLSHFGFAGAESKSGQEF